MSKKGMALLFALELAAIFVLAFLVLTKTVLFS